MPLFFYCCIHKRMPHEQLFHQSKADKLCQQLYGTVTGQASQSGKAVERERLGGIDKELQQCLLALSEGEQRTTVPTLFAPQRHLNGRGHDVLIGNAHEGTEAVIVETGTHGTLLGALHLGNHHTAPLDAMHGHVARYGRYTVNGCSSLHHVYLFIAAHTGNLSIVLHADEQSPTFRIGKSRQSARNLARIGDLILEILQLVFALGDEVVKHGVI